MYGAAVVGHGHRALMGADLRSAEMELSVVAHETEAAVHWRFVLRGSARAESPSLRRTESFARRHDHGDVRTALRCAAQKRARV